MAPAIDIQSVLRFRNIQFLKEHVGHVGVKMLARVDHHLVDTPSFANRTAHRSCLDELRPGTDDGDNFLDQLYAFTCGT